MNTFFSLLTATYRAIVIYIIKCDVGDSTVNLRFQGYQPTKYKHVDFFFEIANLIVFFCCFRMAFIDFILGVY